MREFIWLRCFFPLPKFSLTAGLQVRLECWAKMRESVVNHLKKMDNSEIKIIDSHSHIGKWGRQVFYGRRIDPFRGQERDSFEKVQVFLEKNNIDRAILVPTYCPDSTVAFETNFVLVEYARRAKGKIVPGFWVDPSPQVRNLLTNTIEFAMENRIQVLKTSPDAWADPYSPDPSTWDSVFTLGIEIILEYVRSKQAVFQIHTGSGKSNIQIIEKFIRFVGPGITFHLVHMGNTASGHFYLLPRMEEWISQGLDIVCDTSWSCGFALRWVLREALIKPEFANRILFGSDEPWSIFESEFSKVIHAAESQPCILRKVLWENADYIYPRWDVMQ